MRPPGEPLQQMYLHLSIDFWKADIMSLSPEGAFLVVRMLPPGRTWYFFSEGSRVLLRNDRPVAVHPRLNVERNYIDVPRNNAFAGYRRVKFRDTPCVLLDDRVDLPLQRAEWDPARSPFRFRIRLSDGLFDTASHVRVIVEQDVDLTKLLKLKASGVPASIDALQPPVTRTHLTRPCREFTSRDRMSPTTDDVHTPCLACAQVIDREGRAALLETLLPLYPTLARLYQSYAASDPETSAFELTSDQFMAFCKVRSLRGTVIQA
jgi:hypothetical protein